MIISCMIVSDFQKLITNRFNFLYMNISSLSLFLFYSIFVLVSKTCQIAWISKRFCHFLFEGQEMVGEWIVAMVTALGVVLRQMMLQLGEEASLSSLQGQSQDGTSQGGTVTARGAIQLPIVNLLGEEDPLIDQMIVRDLVTATGIEEVVWETEEVLIRRQTQPRVGGVNLLLTGVGKQQVKIADLSLLMKIPGGDRVVIEMSHSSNKPKVSSFISFCRSALSVTFSIR